MNDDLVWAWESKLPGSRREYAVLSTNATGTVLEEVTRDLERLRLGNPIEGDRSAGALPWYAFVPDRDPSVLRVLRWDWTEHRDFNQRLIAAVLYLRFPYDGRTDHVALARYADAVWKLLDTDQSAIVPPVPAPATTGWVDGGRDDDPFPRMASVAALSMCRPVRFTPHGHQPLPDPLTRVQTFASVAALVPAGVRPLLRMSTWLEGTNSALYNVTFATDTDPRAVSVIPGHPADLGAHGAAADYCRTLLSMRQLHGTAPVLNHLTASDEPVEKLGSRAAVAASEALGTIDRLLQVATDIVHRRPVHLSEARDLAERNDLAQRLNENQHVAFLGYLLRHGHPDDAHLVGRRWHDRALPEVVAVARDRAATDEAWLRAVIGMVHRRDLTDPFLAGLLDAAAEKQRPPALRDALVRLLISFQPPTDPHLPLVRGRLLTDAHLPTAHGLLAAWAAESDVMTAWLAWLARYPAAHDVCWVDLLRVAVGVPTTPAPAVTGDAWLTLAYDVALNAGRLTHLLMTAMPTFLASLPHSPTIRGRLRSQTTDDPAFRASADLMLLDSEAELPPGLWHGSAWACDATYARQLLDGAVPHSDCIDVFALRQRVLDALGRPAATTDALHILNEWVATGSVDRDRFVEGAVSIVDRIRPDLLVSAIPNPLWDLMVARAPYLRLKRALMNLDGLIARHAPVPEFAAGLVEAFGYGGGPDDIGPVLQRWPDVHSVPHLGGLANALAAEFGAPIGAGHTDDRAALTFLCDMLPPRTATDFGNWLIAVTTDRHVAIRRQIDELERQRIDCESYLRLVSEVTGMSLVEPPWQRPQPPPRPEHPEPPAEAATEAEPVAPVPVVVATRPSRLRRVLRWLALPYHAAVRRITQPPAGRAAGEDTR